jgi:hypothetical protein
MHGIFYDSYGFAPLMESLISNEEISGRKNASSVKKYFYEMVDKHVRQTVDLSVYAAIAMAVTFGPSYAAGSVLLFPYIFSHILKIGISSFYDNVAERSMQMASNYAKNYFNKFCYGLLPYSQEEHALYGLNESPTDLEKIFYMDEYEKREKLRATSLTSSVWNDLWSSIFASNELSDIDVALNKANERNDLITKTQKKIEDKRKAAKKLLDIFIKISREGELSNNEEKVLKGVMTGLSYADKKNQIRLDCGEKIEQNSQNDGSIKGKIENFKKLHNKLSLENKDISEDNLEKFKKTSLAFNLYDNNSKFILSNMNYQEKKYYLTINDEKVLQENINEEEEILKEIFTTLYDQSYNYWTHKISDITFNNINKNLMERSIESIILTEIKDKDKDNIINEIYNKFDEKNNKEIAFYYEKLKNNTGIKSKDQESHDFRQCYYRIINEKITKYIQYKYENKKNSIKVEIKNNHFDNIDNNTKTIDDKNENKNIVIIEELEDDENNDTSQDNEFIHENNLEELKSMGFQLNSKTNNETTNEISFLGYIKSYNKDKDNEKNKILFKIFSDKEKNELIKNLNDYIFNKQKNDILKNIKNNDNKYCKLFTFVLENNRSEFISVKNLFSKKEYFKKYDEILKKILIDNQNKLDQIIFESQK